MRENLKNILFNLTRKLDIMNTTFYSFRLKKMEKVRLYVKGFFYVVLPFVDLGNNFIVT